MTGRPTAHLPTRALVKRSRSGSQHAPSRQVLTQSGQLASADWGHHPELVAYQTTSGCHDKQVFLKTAGLCGTVNLGMGLRVGIQADCHSGSLHTLPSQLQSASRAHGWWRVHWVGPPLSEYVGSWQLPCARQKPGVWQNPPWEPLSHARGRYEIYGRCDRVMMLLPGGYRWGQTEGLAVGWTLRESMANCANASKQFTSCMQQLQLLDGFDLPDWKHTQARLFPEPWVGSVKGVYLSVQSYHYEARAAFQAQYSAAEAERMKWLEDVLLCEGVAESAVGEGTMASTGQALHEGLEGLGGCCGQGKDAKKLQQV
ncbi:MAG: hypothetical protein FRX49_01718 [Trebouxia sp. A1-2]|nr:MAG: hypothetical protein FRX49_01718 [Trebouxia sp. A1-2]